MIIELNSEQAEVVDRAIQAGVIHNVDEVVQVGIQTINSRLSAQASKQDLPFEEWSKAFHTWVDSHPTDGPVLPDEAMERESIYGDRGL
jgi:hypothetical protein